MITVFIDGYYEVSGVWGLWGEQSPGLRAGSRVIRRETAQAKAVEHEWLGMVEPAGWTGSRWFTW